MISQLEEKINEILPQTQCQRCGYSGCAPYAQAIATGAAPINRCPPGGPPVIKKLADLLHVSALELDPQYGSSSPRQVAYIVEHLCIGCTKCLPVCPVDAIVGGPKRLHTVIQNSCTGCELCLPACPVSGCIVLTSPPVGQEGWSHSQREAAVLDYRKAITRRENATRDLKTETEIVKNPQSARLQSIHFDQQTAARQALALALQIASPPKPVQKN